MGIQYRFIWIYRLLIPITHRKSVVNSFAKAVGNNVSVFEVACGFGLAADYLDKTVNYRGIDLNKKFVRYAQKKGKDVRLGDIFENKSYEYSDVILLVDIIHHMHENKLPELFDKIFMYAQKKVVILEPSFTDLQSKYGPLGGIVDWLFKKLDSDGINTIERWYSEAEYAEMFNSGFGSKLAEKFEVSVEKVWPYNLVTYSRK